MRTLIFSGIGLAIVALAIFVGPDLKRYIKISTM
jgi:hypothetical protein